MLSPHWGIKSFTPPPLFTPIQSTHGSTETLDELQFSGFRLQSTFEALLFHYGHLKVSYRMPWKGEIFSHWVLDIGIFHHVRFVSINSVLKGDVAMPQTILKLVILSFI